MWLLKLHNVHVSDPRLYACSAVSGPRRLCCPWASQVRTLGWAATPFSAPISCVSRIGRQIPYHRATWKSHIFLMYSVNSGWDFYLLPSMIGGYALLLLFFSSHISHCIEWMYLLLLFSRTSSPHGQQHARLLSSTVSRSLLRFTSIEVVMPSNHHILCFTLLLFPSVFPSIRVFSNKSVVCKYTEYRVFVKTGLLVLCMWRFF